MNKLQTPITTFTLYKTNFDSSYKNVMDFANDTERQAYLSSLPHASYTSSQYIRKDTEIRVPAIYDDVERYNYVVYDNGLGLGKTYAFILEKEFINGGMTKLIITTDVWQNNLFNFLISECYVEREHKDRFRPDGTPIFYRTGENFNATANYSTLLSEVFSTDGGHDPTPSEYNGLIFAGRNRVSQPYKEGTHKGIDIVAMDDRNIHNLYAGTVVENSFHSSWGNRIMILDESTGLRHHYCHMASLSTFKVGDAVAAGTIIGIEGSTGNSTGLHTHYEVWTGTTSDTRINPAPYAHIPNEKGIYTEPVGV